AVQSVNSVWVGEGGLGQYTLKSGTILRSWIPPLAFMSLMNAWYTASCPSRMLSVYCLMQSKSTNAIPSLIESLVTPLPSEVSVGVVEPGVGFWGFGVLVPEPQAIIASTANRTPATNGHLRKRGRPS